METRDVLTLVGIICSGLFFIPIKINHEPSNENVTLFSDYIKRFNKSYGKNDTEYKLRFEHFKASLRRIEELNKNRTNNMSAIYGLTVYSDMSKDEFLNDRLQSNQTNLLEHLPHRFRKKLFKKIKKQQKKKGSVHTENNSIENMVSKERLRRAIDDLPNKVDWRDRGVISTVRNQKTCGACWAFSTIETVEAMNAIKKELKSVETLSVQEVIDCAKNNYGCEGGDACNLLKWLSSSQVNITLEKNYPFAYETQTCKLNGPSQGVQVKNYSCDNFVGNEIGLLQKLAYHGPIAVAVNAINWQFYLGGVIQFHCSGSPTNLNHAVQIVGYDKTGPVPYYIARNSWGVEFGDKGYIYIAMNGNVCGIANEVSSLDTV